MGNRRVVITGLGAVSPVGNSMRTSFDSLKEGKNGIDHITRFDTSGIKAKLAAEVKAFDPGKYFAKIEMMRTDLFVQYAVAAAEEAVKESGIIGRVDPEKIGVYIASGIGGIGTLESEERKLIEKGPGRVSPYFVPMMIANMASGAVAIRYGCLGPSMSHLSACASGSNAIGEALRLIRHGYADACIAGGSEASITKVGVAGFSNMLALSQSTVKDAASLPFDKRRNGFVIGEGSAVLVLEEYESAKARGAKIYAEVAGYGSTTDAHHITSPRPDGKEAARAMEIALEEAGYKSGEKIYINAHGTGTVLNDKTETLAIKKALGKDAEKAFISSTKSATGHMLGAAGAFEAAVSAMVLSENILPPTLNLREKDEECDLDYIPLSARDEKVDIVLSNSLGFGGHNAALAFRRV